MDILRISYFNILVWCIIGVMIGYFVHRKDKKSVAGGTGITILFGILGAFTSGYLTSFLSGKEMLHFNIFGLLLAAAGAFCISYFYRTSFEREKEIKIT